MDDRSRTSTASPKSVFLREGWRELLRRWERGKLRKQAQKSDEERNSALTRLGENAWNANVDLSALPELREQLTRLTARAGELTAVAKKLEEEKAALEAQRQAASARFDSLQQAVLEKKRPVDTALTAARERLAQQDATVKELQARLTSLAAATAALGKEPAPPAQNSAPTGVAQTPDLEKRKQELEFEQALASQELTKLNFALPQVSAEVRRNYEESQRHEQELAKITAEHKAALAPIENGLDRVARDTNTASQEAGAVAQQRRSVLAQLGLALYQRKSAEPALAAGMLEVAGIDRSRASTQAGLEASLAASRAIPPGTMLKFFSVLLIVPVLLVGLGFSGYRGWQWWMERNESNQSEQVRMKVNSYLTHPLSNHPAYVLANQLAEAKSEQEVQDLLLEAFRTIHLGVYTSRGKKILGGAERNDRDFYLYDFLWKTLAHGYASHTVSNWENQGQLFGRDLLHLQDPSLFQFAFAQAVQARYQQARSTPKDPKSFVILLVDGLARQQLKPYTLSELTTRSTKDLYVDRVQSFLLMLDFFTRLPKAASPRSRLLPFRPSLEITVYAAQEANPGCASVDGGEEESYFGQGLNFLLEKAENILEEVGVREEAKKAAQEAAKEEAQNLAEQLASIVGGVAQTMNVNAAIDAISLLSGVTVTVHANPNMIHVPHQGQNRISFTAQVTADAEDLPPEPIPCGPLQGNSMVPAGRRALKNVRVEWDWDHDFETHYEWSEDTHMTGRNATFTDESGQTQIAWVSRKICQGKGTVVGPDYVMQATAVSVLDPAFEALVAGSNPLTLILKAGPSIYQFVAPETRGYVNYAVRWHRVKPKKPQRGDGDPNTSGSRRDGLPRHDTEVLMGSVAE